MFHLQVSIMMLRAGCELQAIQSGTRIPAIQQHMDIHARQCSTKIDLMVKQSCLFGEFCVQQTDMEAAAVFILNPAVFQMCAFSQLCGGDAIVEVHGGAAACKPLDDGEFAVFSGPDHDTRVGHQTPLRIAPEKVQD